jgi:hypothetical protein
LWQESPWIGVGGSEIALGSEIAQAFRHAYTLYFDELARRGLVCFVIQFAAVGFGVSLASRAAGGGKTGSKLVTVA